MHTFVRCNNIAGGLAKAQEISSYYRKAASEQCRIQVREKHYYVLMDGEPTK